MKETPLHSRILKSEYPTVAKEIVSGIECQALSIGWMSSQLEELEKILIVYIPAKIGAVKLRSIEIIILHNDGKQRGAVRFYNTLVTQPWLKVVGSVN